MGRDCEGQEELPTLGQVGELSTLRHARLQHSGRVGSYGIDSILRYQVRQMIDPVRRSSLKRCLALDIPIGIGGVAQTVAHEVEG